MNSPVIVTANSALYLTVGPSVPLTATATASTGTMPVPEFVLGPGATIAPAITNGFAADTYVVTVCVEEYND